MASNLPILCSICENDLEANCSHVATCPCGGQVFHKDCVPKSPDESLVCRHCKKCLNSETVIELYFNYLEDNSPKNDDEDHRIFDEDKLMANLQTSKNTIADLEQKVKLLQTEVLNQEDLRLQKQKLEEDNLVLESELQKFDHIEKLILGDDTEFQDLLEKLKERPDSLQRSVRLCIAMKNHLSVLLESECQLKNKEFSHEKDFSDIGKPVDGNLLREQILAFEKENEILCQKMPGMNDATKRLLNALDSLEELKDGSSDSEFQIWLETRLRLLDDVILDKNN